MSKNKTNEKRQLKKYRKDMRTSKKFKEQAMASFINDVLDFSFSERFAIAMRIIRGRKRGR